MSKNEERIVQWLKIVIALIGLSAILNYIYGA